MREQTRQNPRARQWWARGITALFLCGVVGLAVMNLPRPFDTDLGKIGTGQPALVFVYDPNLSVSHQQTREMDHAREVLGHALHFLVADVGRPGTQQFMARQGAGPTQLLLFDGKGTLVHTSHAPMSKEQLLAWHEQASGLR